MDDINNSATPSTTAQKNNHVDASITIVPKDAGQFIFGARHNITTEELLRRVRQFFTKFEVQVPLVNVMTDSNNNNNNNDTSTITKFKYNELLTDLVNSEESYLEVDCKDLHSFDEPLYYFMLENPLEIIGIMDEVATELYKLLRLQLIPTATSDVTIQVQPYNLLKMQQMRELDPSDIDHLVCIRGMVTRLSEIIPDLRKGLFECSNCKATQVSNLKNGRIEEPTLCTGCQARYTCQIIHNRSTFSDRQLIKFQETPESIPEGHTPHTVTLVVHDHLVDSVKPGDRVNVVGIFRATPQRISPNVRTVKSVYRTYLDVVHFEKVSGIRILADSMQQQQQQQQQQQPQRGEEEEEQDTYESQDRELRSQEVALQDQPTEDDEDDNLQLKREMNITAEEESKLISLSRRFDIYGLLTKSIAPSIFEMDDVKKGILCQLFGGTNKKIPNGKLRGEINVLLVGDPGVSKSQLLKHVHHIAPRGIYTSGKGSSAVGLTAYVTRDPDTGDFVLESGALVLSDYGVCCIDEFDKMNDSTRSILHEVMEQQTVSVAKAGIICSLNARTSILAAANPKESTYNDKLSIVDNIQLPPTLLSRFDLIFLLRDIPEKGLDSQLCHHILQLYQPSAIQSGSSRRNNNSQSDSIDTHTLTRYVTYAKNIVHPKISEEASETLVEGYVELRRIGSQRKQITATTRQLESLIRLSEAQARMRLSSIVTREHVEEALRLVRVSIFKAATDPKSGMVDIDLLNTGKTMDQRLQEEQEREQQEIDESGGGGGGSDDIF
jgi:DNA replication licensing factor MCM4